MKRVFTYQVVKQRGGHGLSRIEGKLEAHDVKEAHQQINELVAENAQAGLMKGDYYITLNDANRVYATRDICVHSTYEFAAIPDGGVQQHSLLPPLTQAKEDLEAITRRQRAMARTATDRHLS